MSDLSVTISPTSPVPLYHQVARQLESAITSGNIAKGQLLPSEIELAAQWGVSRPTARRAIQELVDAGLLVRRRGVGTHVVNQELRRHAGRSSLYDDLTESGRDPRSTVLRLERVEADEEVATALETSVGTPVVFVERLRSADGRPLGLMRNWVLGSVADDLRAEDLEHTGLYEWLRARRVRPHVVERVIGAAVAGREQARALGLRAGAPLVTMRVTMQDSTGRRVEYGSHVYDAEDFTVEMRIVEN